MSFIYQHGNTSVTSWRHCQFGHLLTSCLLTTILCDFNTIRWHFSPWVIVPLSLDVPVDLPLPPFRTLDGLHLQDMKLWNSLYLFYFFISTYSLPPWRHYTPLHFLSIFSNSSFFIHFWLFLLLPILRLKGSWHPPSLSPLMLWRTLSLGDLILFQPPRSITSAWMRQPKFFLLFSSALPRWRLACSLIGFLRLAVPKAQNHLLKN